MVWPALLAMMGGGGGAAAGAGAAGGSGLFGGLLSSVLGGAMKGGGGGGGGGQDRPIYTPNHNMVQPMGMGMGMWGSPGHPMQRLIGQIASGELSNGNRGGQGTPTPYQLGEQPGGGANPSASGNFWGNLGKFMMSEDEGGNSPTSSLLGMASNALSSVPKALSDSRTGPIGTMPHPVQSVAHGRSPGLMGLNQLIAGSAQGGWGRGR